jgi:hypothetical protein
VTEVFLNLTEVFLNLTEVFLILTEGFPCFFLSCKANARVKLAKTGHGPHSSTLVVTVYISHCYIAASFVIVPRGFAYFTRIDCTLLTCDIYVCRLRHIHDPVLLSLKMEGIRLLFMFRFFSSVFLLPLEEISGMRSFVVKTSSTRK